MNKGMVGSLSLVLVFLFAAYLSTSSIAQDAATEKTGEMKSMEGNVYCVELDDKGQIIMKEEWTECKGSLVAAGADGKSYVVTGTIEDTKMIMKQPDEKKTVSGIISGHNRGWILAAASAEHPEQAVTSTEDITVKGTIVCLLPNYQAGNFKQVVAAGPCTELEQHVHVIQTSDGQVYAIHGSEEAIHRIESMPNRNEVELQGKIQGDQGAWVLFVQ
ncbi:MAG: hypothetical protein WBD99_14845 [Thermodesulfobacteriota bacterium]